MRHVVVERHIGLRRILLGDMLKNASGAAAARVDRKRLALLDRLRRWRGRRFGYLARRYHQHAAVERAVGQIFGRHRNRGERTVARGRRLGQRGDLFEHVAQPELVLPSLAGGRHGFPRPAEQHLRRGLFRLPHRNDAIGRFLRECALVAKVQDADALE